MKTIDLGEKWGCFVQADTIDEALCGVETTRISEELRERAVIRVNWASLKKSEEVAGAWECSGDCVGFFDKPEMAIALSGGRST
ncbi:MAG: hypothetical protein ACYCZ0_05100 [Minisyncoccota bacterium]